jgi:GntR family transcriptional regulator, transcriptional repressor for pyruvate dehydrogenase complex
MTSTDTGSTVSSPGPTPGAETGGGVAGPRINLPVSRLQPAYQQVADQLRTLIIQGELVSGDRLPPEAELGSSFGVSRSTVREALRSLASQGLIETTRGTTGGTFVSRIKPAAVTNYLETSIGLMSGTDDLTIAHLLEARDMLEAPAAALAARRHQPEHIEALRQAITREKASRGRTGKFSEHRQFHGLLMAATGNGLLPMVADPIFRVLQTRFLNPVEAEGFWAMVDQDHEEIVERVEAGDADGASAAMRAHRTNIRSAYHD